MSEWSDPVDGFKWLRARQPSGIFYIRRKTDGVWKNVTLETVDVEEAKRRYVEQIGAPIPENRNVRCSEAFDAFVLRLKASASTKKDYKGDWLNYAKTWLGSKRVAEVTAKDIIQVLEASTTSVRTGKPLSADSKRGIYVMLSAFFKSCTEEPTHYRDDNPVSRIGKAYRPDAPVSGLIGDEVVASDEELEKIAGRIGVCDNPKRPDEVLYATQLEFLCRFMPLVGGRLGELLGFELTSWNRFARPYGEITFKQKLSPTAEAGDASTWFEPLKGKEGTVGDEQRTVPLTQAAQELLEAYVDRGSREGWLKPGGLLIPNAKARPRTVPHVSTKISEAASAALGRRYTSHYFRHTFASNLLANGASMEEIAELIGDSVKVCNDRYAHRVNREKYNVRTVALMEGRA